MAVCWAGAAKVSATFSPTESRHLAAYSVAKQRGVRGQHDQVVAELGEHPVLFLPSGRTASSKTCPPVEAGCVSQRITEVRTRSCCGARTFTGRHVETQIAASDKHTGDWSLRATDRLNQVPLMDPSHPEYRHLSRRRRHSRC
jgi:hypothetical protein